MCEVARLRVIDLPLWFDLPHRIERVERTNHDASFIIWLLYYAAEKVVACGRHPVVKDRGVVHVVFKHCQTIVLRFVNLTK